MRKYFFSACLSFIFLLSLFSFFGAKNAFAFFPLHVPSTGTMCPNNGYFLFDSGLLEPGTQNGATICANYCDQNFVNQANAAYNAGSKDKKKFMDNYISSDNGKARSESDCRNALKKLYADPKNDKPVDCVQEGDTTHFATSSDYCIIDESTYRVNLLFKNLENKRSGMDYYICPKNSITDCKGDEWEKVSNPQTGVYTVCGDGNKGLKGKISGDDDECKTNGADWFWPETTYRLYLAQGKNKDNLQNNVVRIASFYVRHFYPQITEPTSTEIVGPVPPGQWDNLYVDSADNGKKTAEITLTMQGRNEKGNTDADRYNDYFIKVFSTENDYRTDRSQCIFIKGPANNPQTVKVTLQKTWTPDDVNILPVDLAPGSYVLRIKDGTDGNFDANDPKCSEGDFTYYDIPFKIGRGHITCTDANGKTSSCIDRGNFGAPIKDPFGKEKYKPGKFITPEPVCTDKDPDTGLCRSIPTALGFSIHTKPTEFISDLFSIALSLGGIASFAFFIRAGYTILTSAGNKEKVGQAREQITAAITGLIFLILSITILEFIGINILHLPGFGR